MLHLGDVPSGVTLYIPFNTYNAAGASVTLTGLAVTDIEIYKNGSVTQRSSDAGYTLLDTDGIDFDGLTGIHGFSVDLSNNTDSGFFSVGAFYWVVISAVTVDSQTVNFVAATFRICAAESSSGTPKADISHYGGTAGTFASGRPEVNVSHIAGSAVSTTTAQLGVNVVQISADSTAADNAESFFDGTGYAGTNNVIPTVTTVNGLAANVITAAATHSDFTTEIQTGLATAANLAVVDGIVDNLVSGIIFGTAATGTLSTTQATSDLSGYANDQLIGRVIIFLSGAAEGEASDITEYASASGLLTFTALTTSPGNGDTFKIV
jgi:hypothetical protein